MNPIEQNKQSNHHGNNLLYSFMDDHADATELKQFIKEHHNKQWSEHIYNILSVKSNCKNDCRYCYMKGMKNRFFNVDLENFDTVIDEKKVNKKWKYTNKPNMIMFPSSHDIYDELTENYITVALKMLSADHSIMIVTKPNLHTINQMIQSFVEYKDKIMFMLTITTSDQVLLDYYEHNAPNYIERRECLKLLYENGYRTSISAEPFLSNPIEMINELNEYVTDNIWLGVMSGINTNSDLSEIEKIRLKTLYSKHNIVRLVNELKTNDKIMWKTSVMKIIISK